MTTTYRAINGTGQPLIKIYIAGGYVRTYTFPLTNEGGLIEEWESNDVEGESIDLDTLQTSYEYYNGYWRGKFTLDYSQFMFLPYQMYVQEISNYQKAGYDLYLVPRADAPDRQFSVQMMNKFSIGISKGGTSAFNKGFTLQFYTKDTYRYGQWTVPSYNEIVLNNFIII